MRGHSILAGPKPPGLLAIVSEPALRYVVGGGDVMRRQLEYPAEAAKQPNLPVRGVPGIGAHTLSGRFELIRRPGGHKVVFLENLTATALSMIGTRPPETLALAR